jgi:protein-glucosylgalactosylhydroxylysine glucosidase
MLYGDVVDVVMVTMLPLPSNTLQMSFNGTNTRMTFITCVATSLESADPLSAALSQFQEVSSIDSEDLWNQHVSAWADLWISGIEVQGRYDVSVAVNASLYYLLSSLRDDHPFGVSPGGLASNGYNGTHS